MSYQDVQPPDLFPIEEQSRLALAEVPHAAAWADRFTRGVRPSTKGFRRQAAPTIVRDAVQGIAQACVPDPDGMLRDLLVQAIGECAALVGRDRPRRRGRLHLVGERVSAIPGGRSSLDGAITTHHTLTILNARGIWVSATATPAQAQAGPRQAPTADLREYDPWPC